ncbi:MAG: tetratricopeptide repeat protein [Pseudomonadota bacterium]
MKHVLLVLSLLAGPALADCQPGQDKTPELEALIDKARSAASEAAGRGVAAEMWVVLLRAPDGTAQEILDRGLARRDSFDWDGAAAAFDQLIAYCPSYAEGYNQRAYIHFLRGDFAAALPDLDAALALNPLHVGAQSGRGLTLMELGQTEAARAQMLAAVENNPWLSERHLLARGAPLGPIGEDI